MADSLAPSSAAAAGPDGSFNAVLGSNTLIKGRWRLIRKVGQGAFGEIYSGRNVVNNEMVAVKMERADSKKQVLKLEVAVLKKLQCAWVAGKERAAAVGRET